MQERGAKLAAAHKVAREQTIAEAAYGWNASPVALARERAVAAQPR